MKRSILVFSIMVVSTAIHAQDSLDLPTALNIALKNSLDLQISRNNIEASTILNNIGIAGGLPSVTGTLSDNEQVTNINQKLNTGSEISRNGAATNNLSVGVAGSFLLYNGGRVIATKKRLEQLEFQSKDQLNSQVQNVMADVMTAYYDVVRQQSYMRTVDRSIEAAAKKLDIVKVTKNAGLANNADLFQAQLDLNALEQSKKAQQVIIDQAKTELLRLLTLKPDSTIRINDTIIVDRSLSLFSILNSLNKNADILAAERQIRVTEFIVKETNALRYPSIRLNSGLNFSRNQAAAGQLLLNQSYGPYIGVTVGIPIYNGGIYRRQEKVAKLDVKNADINRSILLRDYSAQVVKSYQSYSSSLLQLDSEFVNYRLSAQLLDLTLLRFQLRQATIVEVKNAQQSFEQSGFRLVNLSYAAKTAEIELKRLGNQLKL